MRPRQHVVPSCAHRSEMPGDDGQITEAESLEKFMKETALTPDELR